MTSKTLPKEILDFHSLEAEIAKQKTQLDKLSEDIVLKYCPFKKGDKVTYREGWRPDGKIRFGTVERISFKGVVDTAIDNKWRILVNPTRKDFTPMLKRSWVFLGERKGDVIELFVSPMDYKYTNEIGGIKGTQEMTATPMDGGDEIVIMTKGKFTKEGIDLLTGGGYDKG